MRGARDGVDVEWDISAVPVGGGLPASRAIVSTEAGGERVGCWLRCALPDLCVVEWHLRVPHQDLPFHQQDRRVDSFFVIEEELEAMLAGARHTVGPGTLISVPRGVPHTLSYRGYERARMLSLHTPDGGFADYLRRVSGRAAARSAPGGRAWPQVHKPVDRADHDGAADDVAQRDRDEVRGEEAAPREIGEIRHVGL